jgi:SAM-dependent methyltransferase
VGCGAGSASWYLARGRRYVGYEPDEESFRAASERLANVSGALVFNSTLPSPPIEQFDAIVALEVLEHIENDREALSEWLQWVKPGGLILISVPAKQSRYGPMDAAVGHFRRYEYEELGALMRGVGLREVVIRAYGMPLGYLLELVRNLVLARRVTLGRDMKARSATSGRTFQPQRWALARRVVMAPFHVLQRPFLNTQLGIGWIAEGRRPM